MCPRTEKENICLPTPGHPGQLKKMLLLSQAVSVDGANTAKKEKDRGLWWLLLNDSQLTTTYNHLGSESQLRNYLDQIGLLARQSRDGFGIVFVVK